MEFISPDSKIKKEYSNTLESLYDEQVHLLSKLGRVIVKGDEELMVKYKFLLKRIEQKIKKVEQIRDDYLIAINLFGRSTGWEEWHRRNTKQYYTLK